MSVAGAEMLDSFKIRADQVIAKFSGRFPSPLLTKEIELRLRTVMRREFPELLGFQPTIIFREGRPTIFLVADTGAANSNHPARAAK